MATPAHRSPIRGATMQIDRCVCLNLPFAEAVAWARERGVTDVETVRDRLGCGAVCGLCTPYLRRALETGRTAFDEVIVDDDQIHA